MQKFVITTLPEYPKRQFLFQVKDGRVMQICAVRSAGQQLLGNIYIGKIQNIAENIHAAFVEIEGGQLCYVPREELSHAIYTSRPDPWRGRPAGTGCPKPRPGDELLVQVTKEALKTKLPGATGRLSLVGTYLILTPGKCMLGVSGKLSPARKEELKTAFGDLVTEEYGFILRTNAGSAGEALIRKEAKELEQRYETLKQKAVSRSCFSCIERGEEELLLEMRSSNLSTLDEIITDLPDVKCAAERFLAKQPADIAVQLRFYDDPMLPLRKLYSLEKAVHDALKERVWLKSGGYLVIQPTEALTVIDVNTGKYEGNKKAGETFRKINKEAAEEAARQMRLRNLSGIILIDFIDMKDPDHITELISILKTHLRQDPVKTDFVDFTKLGLAEITRKKVRKPLADTLKG